MADAWGVLMRYARVARPIIRQYFRAESCIASTAVTIDVLAACGVKAEPYPCRAFIFNAAFAERIEREGRFPESDEETRAWTTGTGLWSVGIGLRKPGERATGHLIAIAGNQYLVDSSLDQASRPEHDIDLPGVMIAGVSREFRRAEKGAQRVIRSEEGEILIYEPDRKNRLYLDSNDWKQRERREAAIRKILALM